MPAEGPVVVKVGGSLYAWPELSGQLSKFLTGLDHEHVLLVPGGGSLADAVREIDGCHGLGEGIAHMLALRSVSVAAHFLAALLPERRPAMIAEMASCRDAWRQGLLPILDAHAFALLDDGRSGCLAHLWGAATDCLALRAAALTGSRTLILLKSVAIADGTPWEQAAERGWVDPLFPHTLAENLELLAPGFRVRTVNLKTWKP